MPDTVGTPFNRGETWYGPSGTIDTADYGTNQGLEGYQWEGVDIIKGSTPGVKLVSSQGLTTRRIVRNVSGITLTPGRLAVYKAGFEGKRVDGYVTLDAGRAAGVVDDWLPSGTSPRNGDLFWLIEKGRCLVKTALEANVNNVITAGDWLVGLTAATSQATTAGRFVSYVITSNQTYGVSAALNRIGIAVSAKTTANTNADCLVDVKIY